MHCIKNKNKYTRVKLINSCVMFHAPFWSRGSDYPHFHLPYNNEQIQTFLRISSTGNKWKINKLIIVQTRSHWHSPKSSDSRELFRYLPCVKFPKLFCVNHFQTRYKDNLPFQNFIIWVYFNEREDYRVFFRFCQLSNYAGWTSSHLWERETDKKGHR